MRSHTTSSSSPGRENGDEVPHEDVVTRGSRPARKPAEPSLRAAASTAVAPAFIYPVLAVVVLLTALLSDQESGTTAGLLLVSGLLLAIGVMNVTGPLGKTTLSVFGLLLGLFLTVLAFTVSDFGLPQAVLLLCGASLFITAPASLAASRRTGGS